MIERAVAWARANKGKTTAAVLAVLSALGLTVSPELRDILLSVAPVINEILLGP